MEIKIGGHISYRIQIGQYEPTDVGSVLEITKNIDDNNFEEELASLQDKIDKILINDVNKKVEKTCQNYRDKIERLKKII